MYMLMCSGIAGRVPFDVMVSTLMYKTTTTPISLLCISVMRWWRKECSDRGREVALASLLPWCFQLLEVWVEKELFCIVSWHLLASNLGWTYSTQTMWHSLCACFFLVAIHHFMYTGQQIHLFWFLLCFSWWVLSICKVIRSLSHMWLLHVLYIYVTYWCVSLQVAIYASSWI